MRLKECITKECRKNTVNTMPRDSLTLRPTHLILLMRDVYFFYDNCYLKGTKISLLCYDIIRCVKGYTFSILEYFKR